MNPTHSTPRISRIVLLSLFVAMLALTAVAGVNAAPRGHEPAAQPLVTVTVPGTADPWLAGMPPGSTASGGDVVPAQSPVEVPGLDLGAGGFLTFSGATGGVSNEAGCPPTCYPIDGGAHPKFGAIFFPHWAGAENGIATVTAPMNALVGVILGEGQPNLSPAPESLDFQSLGRDFLTLSPKLKQVFFIGDGLTSTGAVQHFNVPAGATRLFLGTMDNNNWFDNSGSLSVRVAATPRGPCSTWDLAADFRTSPNQENPSRDSCANPGVWYYMEGPENRDPLVYRLLPNYAWDPYCAELRGWRDSNSDQIPHVSYNSLDTPLGCNGFQLVPPHTVFVNPATGTMAIVGWHSPIDGPVSITGSATDVDNRSIGGILWFIDRGSTSLASGAVPEGGRQDFRDGTGGSALSRVEVHKGEYLYFIVHEGQVSTHDTTALVVTIKQLEPVLLEPSSQTRQGGRGERVTFEETLTNLTGASDSFTLTLQSGAWASSLTANRVGPLASGGSITLTASITVPAGAAWYSTDVATVTAISASQPAVYSDTARLTAQAYAPPSIGVSPAALTSSQAINEIVTKPLTIGNGNGVTLTFDATSLPALDPVLMLHLDEPAGATTFHDDSGNDLNGTCVGASCPTAGAAGKAGYAAKFDGSDDYIKIGSPVPPALQLQNELSLAAWIYVTGYPAYDTVGIVAAENDTTQQGYGMRLDGRTNSDGQPCPPGHIHFQILGSGQHATNSNSQVPLNQWVHVVAVRKANEDGRIYYNGVLQPSTSAPWSGSIGYDSVEMDVGREGSYANRNLSGMIDEVAVFTRALSTQEVEALYLSTGKGKAVPWLATDPVSGSVASQSAVPVNVTFDATGMQPGRYNTEIKVRSNDPVRPSISVPVTMEVHATATMGWVQGTVTDAGTGVPLTATIAAVGRAITTTTGVDGSYKLWLEQGSYSLQAAASGYLTQTAAVDVVAQQGLTRNFALELNAPRLGITPRSLDVTQHAGDVTTRTLTISNTGIAPLSFEITGTLPVSDDFNTDSGLWEYRGNAYRDQAGGSLVLTTPSSQQAGVAWLKSEVRAPFEAQFRFLSGWSDGLVFLFYKDSNYVPDIGGCLAFGQGRGPTPADTCRAPGYGIEFDGIINSDALDPPDEHIALIKDSVLNHIAWVADQRVSDDQWHAAQVEVTTDSVKVFVDGGQVLSWQGALDLTHGRLGFSGATGDFTGWHRIDDFRLETSGALTDWLKVAPRSGTVGPRESLPITATFDAKGLLYGNFLAHIVVASNDPSTPTAIVTATMVVEPRRVAMPLVLRRWPPYPGEPTLNPISPTGFNSYEVSWTAAELATSYALQEDAEGAFPNPRLVYAGPATSWQSGGKAPGRYCYKAQGLNAYAMGPWSNQRCVEVVQLQDNFSNPKSGWEVSDDAIARLRYLNGEYQVLVKQADYTVGATRDFGENNYSVEVDGRAVSHLNGAYGLIFSRTGGGYYLYWVDDGAFGLWRLDRAQGAWTTLIDWTPSAAIRPGNQVNRLRVVRQGSAIMLYANGDVVGKADDGTYISGEAGMAAGAGAADFDSRFDNFQINYVSTAAGQAVPQGLLEGASAGTGAHEEALPMEHHLPSR